jgi:hypothetical protein
VVYKKELIVQLIKNDDRCKEGFYHFDRKYMINEWYHCVTEKNEFPVSSKVYNDNTKKKEEEFEFCSISKRIILFTYFVDGDIQ